MYYPKNLANVFLPANSTIAEKGRDDRKLLNVSCYFYITQIYQVTIHYKS